MDFLWGAATSSYQVEGANTNDWSEFEKKRALERSGRAVDHYRRFADDFTLAKNLGHNAHRFSLEWSRIEPEQGTWNDDAVRHYQDVVRALRERRVEPFITLWHWTSPLWFRDRGGWLRDDSDIFFARYAERMAKALPDVSLWATVNEPVNYCWNGYVRGRWPPGKRGRLFAYRRAHANLARAHRAARSAIRTLHPRASVGVAENLDYIEANGVSFVDRALAGAFRHYWNHAFLDGIADAQDFVGVNYYFHNRVRWGFNRNANEYVSDIGWEIYPLGLAYVLEEVAQRYGKPIYVLENGLADEKDIQRAEFIRGHIRALRVAQMNGADVRGYFHWSLLDNFEWHRGFAPRFGLIEVDRKTLERRIRPSAWAYRELILRAQSE